MLDKFNDNMKNNMNNLYKKVKYRKNKLDKLNNNAKKLNTYIRENNDKLDNANNEYNNVLLEYNWLRGEFLETKDKLYGNENK